MKKFICIITLLIPCLVFSTPTKEAMLNDLEALKNTYQVKYAPAIWKKQYLNWDLEDAAAQAVESIEQLEQPSVKQYQAIVMQFLQSMQDLHVNVQFFSTEFSALLFCIKEIDNRFFISAVHSLYSEVFADKLNKGDEVLEFNGVPIQTVFEGIMQQKHYNSEDPTYRAIAARYMTLRSATRGLKAEEGEITLKVKRLNSGKIETVKTEWVYRPEKITNGFHTEVEMDKKLIPFSVEMCTPIYKRMAEENRELSQAVGADDDDSLEFLGKRKGFVPVLGKVMWETGPNCFYHAYIYQTKDRHQVGYIRIPSFSPSSLFYSINAIRDFALILNEFEDETEGLIIDVTDNPGGMALYMYALASMLTDKPLTPPKYRESITQQDVYSAHMAIDQLEWITSDFIARLLFGDMILGYPVSAELVQDLVKHMHFIIDQWNSGKQMTDYDYMMGMSKIKPHYMANYTKPIIVLTNECSVSCGDFFPAILQDNKRAVIFGAKTSGAGGAVEHFTHPSIFGLASYSCTVSLAARVNNEPIENLGVSPDISYRVTPQDVQNNYQGYKEALNAAVRKTFF